MARRLRTSALFRKRSQIQFYDTSQPRYVVDAGVDASLRTRGHALDIANSNLDAQYLMPFLFLSFPHETGVREY